MSGKFLDKLDLIPDKLPVISEKALEKAGAAVREEMRKKLSAVISSSERSTGELLSSLGVTDMKVDSDGKYNVKVGFNEPRRVQPKAVSSTSKKKYAKKNSRSYYKQTNAMLANVLEHGKRIANQPPRPFLEPTKNATRNAVQKTMKDIFKEELEKL